MICKLYIPSQDRIHIYHCDNLLLTLGLLVSSADNLCKQLGPRSGPTVSGLIWIQAVWHWWYSWKNFSKKLILKKSADDKKSMKNYPGGKVLGFYKWSLSADDLDFSVAQPEHRKSYAHQRETIGSSSDSLHLRPFSKWELLLKERICSEREQILSFKSSSLWYGKSLLPH